MKSLREVMKFVRLDLVRKAIMAVVSMIALTNCIPDPLEVKNIPEIKPQIVVSSQIIPDESLVVFLSKTIGALDVSDNDDPREVFNYIAVDDALVTIEGPNGTNLLISLGLGFYGGVDIQFIEGETYHLRVESESLGKVEATTTAVSQVLFDSVEVERYFNDFDDTLAQVTYTIQDPIEKNHYMINVQRVSLNDPPIYERVLNPGAYTRLVNDEDFEGNKIGETFRAVWDDYQEGDTVLVSLANINRDYYDYLQLRLDNRFGLVEFVSEPINYPTNVIGGRGFFNLYIPDMRFFVMK